MVEYRSSQDSKGYYLKLWIDPITHTSQDLANNSTRLRVRLNLNNTTTAFAMYDINATVTVAGQRLTYSGRPDMYSYNSQILLFDRTISVSHDADGRKTVDISATLSGSGGWSPNTLTVNRQLLTLVTIARTSSLSVSNSLTMGESTTITIARNSSSFSHKLTYHFGNAKGTIAENVGTSATWTPSLLLASEIPNSSTGRGTITCETYNGGRKVGEEAIAVNIAVPDNDATRPSFNGITLTEGNATVSALLGTTSNTFLEIMSDIAVSYTGGAGRYGSTITGFFAEIVGRAQSTNTNGGRLGSMKFDGPAKIRARVIDSRGRTSNYKEVDITVLDYQPPSLKVEAARVGSGGTTIQVWRTASISPLVVGGSQKNVMTLTFKTKEKAQASYTVNSGAGGTFTTLSSLTNSQASLSGSFAANKTYDIEATLSDKFTETKISVIVSTEAVVFAYDRNRRFGIGKMPEFGALDVDGDIYANGKRVQQYELTNPSGHAPMLPNGTDFNAVTKTGFYTCNSSRNNPLGRGQWHLLVLSESDNYWQQTATQKGMTQRQFIRVRNGAGIWTPWQELAIQGQSPIFQGITANGNASIAGTLTATGAVTAKQLTITDTIRTTITMPFGLQADAVRKGNLVTLTIKRGAPNNPINIASVGEETPAPEVIPLGYRPAVDRTAWILSKNVNAEIRGWFIFYINQDGKLRYTNQAAGYSVFTGTITYITDDPI